ncbi:MAG: Gfo/Idh/MocA family oxidoreductase [Planctomycetota bacterium]
MNIDVASLRQSPELPDRMRPIVSIGAGGIVKDAHLPAYRKAGFQVAAIFDVDSAKASKLADDYSVDRVCASLDEAIETAPSDAVFDVAIPASHLVSTLGRLPEESVVLIQKPLGENLQDAQRIRALCTERKLVAAVNFQLRYAPYILAARHLIEQGVIGDLHDLEVRVTVFMPWQLWTFLEGIPRVEILYHSVHYVDLIRSFVGDPDRVYARTIKHPKVTKLASTRSNIILDYGEDVRANITTNHGHEFGFAHQESYVKWEGTRGAIKARLGLLMNYPEGVPDRFEYCVVEGDQAAPDWKEVPLQGSWYPDAFVGPMSDLVRFANGESDALPTRVDDALRTMAVVEAAYESSEIGGVKPSWGDAS